MLKRIGTFVINKDYILRLAERIGREISILLGLRQRDKHEEALIYIDDLLLNTTGLTSRFINSLSEETLLRTLLSLDATRVDLSRWLTVATCLKVEGDIYEDMGQSNESYYRYLKSLFLFLEALNREPIEEYAPFATSIHELLEKLSDYEIPKMLKYQIFWYYEYKGEYGKAEDSFLDLQETLPNDQELRDKGLAFYRRLQAKSDADLHAGNFSREEIEEGIEKLRQHEA